MEPTWADKPNFMILTLGNFYHYYLFKHIKITVELRPSEMLFFNYVKLQAYSIAWVFYPFQISTQPGVYASDFTWINNFWELFTDFSLTFNHIEIFSSNFHIFYILRDIFETQYPNLNLGTKLWNRQCNLTKLV